MAKPPTHIELGSMVLPDNRLATFRSAINIGPLRSDPDNPDSVTAQVSAGPIEVTIDGYDRPCTINELIDLYREDTDHE